MTTPYDVIVVGAGISGLVAAKTIHQQASQLNLLLLEATYRVGGRTFTVKMPTAGGTTDSFDLGAQWVGGNHRALASLLKEYGITTFAQHNDGVGRGCIGSPSVQTFDRLWCKNLMNTDTFKREYKGELGAAELEDISNLFRKLVEAENMIGDVTDPFGAHPEFAASADARTLADWGAEICQTKAGRDVAELLGRMTYGLPANRINFLYHLVYSKASGGSIALVTMEDDGAQTKRIKGGSQQVSLRMAAELKKAEVEIRHGAVVSKIDTSRLTLPTVTLENGETLHGRRVIVAIPPNQCARLQFSPPLPPLKKRFVDSATPGHMFKFTATFESRFWVKNGHSGFVTSSVPSEFRPVSEMYDGTTADGRPALIGFVHPEAEERMSAEQRKEAVIQDLVRFLGPLARTELIAYAEKNWALERFAGGCPVNVMPCGCMDAFMAARDVHGAVHFAGTETALENNGYMDGAVQAGLRAAQEVLEALDPSSSKRSSSLAAVKQESQSLSFSAASTRTAPDRFSSRRSNRSHL